MQSKSENPIVIKSNELKFDSWQKFVEEDWEGSQDVNLCAVFTNHVEKFALPMAEIWKVEELLKDGASLRAYSDFVEEGVIVHPFNKETLLAALVELDKGNTTLSAVEHVKPHTNFLEAFTMEAFS